jgi:hypothetical protein
MPSLFWLALLLGYLVGVGGAIALLPAPLIEPVYGPLALTTALVVSVAGALWRSHHRQRRARGLQPGAPPPEVRATAALTTEPSPAARPMRPRAAPDAGGELKPERPKGNWPLLLRLESPDVLGPSELRRTLYDGRVDALLRPLINLAEPDAPVQHAVARLCAADGTPLPPARYQSTAARCGLLGLIDRLLVTHCAKALLGAAGEGRELAIVCEIAAESLTDPGFVTELGDVTVETPQLAPRLILALDRTRLDPLAERALGRLRTSGLRVCLKRIGPPPLDAAGLAARGFGLVMLEASRFAHAAGDREVEPALVGMQRRLAAAGLELLVGQAEPGPTIEVLGDPGAAGRAATMAQTRPSAA